jgi:hypothetical protein
VKATDEILSSIDGRLVELSREIAVLEAARTALGTPAAPAPALAAVRKPAARRAAAPRARATRRTGVIVPAGKLEAVLLAGGDLSTTTIADQTGGDRDQVLTLLRELEAAGRVLRVGEKRGTRWHVVTDEERVERRAAELAAQSRTGG